VSFRDFWVPVSYLLKVIAKHNFIANCRLGAGLDGPMLSIFSSVLAVMNKSNLNNVTKD
jgi:hypothetical protein